MRDSATRLLIRAGHAIALLAAGTLVGLSGCGGSGSTLTQPTASEQTQQHHKAVERAEHHGAKEAQAHERQATAAKEETPESAEAGTYPEKYGEAYLAGCEHLGGASELCVCILRNSEGKIPFSQFKREGVSAARSKGDTSQAPALSAVVRHCVENQAAKTEQENYNPAREKEKAEAFAANMFGGK
ncbi:MAG: hypothetical protein ACRDK4_08320 [Solirubrobacteraceae bacterium]